MSPSPLSLFVLLGLAACAPVAPREAPSAETAATPPASIDDATPPAAMETPPMLPQDAATCEAAKAQAVVGRKADEGTVQAAMAASGAKMVRVLRPGMMVTQDYRGDRLNLQLDGKGVIASATCG
jgi:Peptidase inhibitor I78 family